MLLARAWVYVATPLSRNRQEADRDAQVSQEWVHCASTRISNSSTTNLDAMTMLIALRRSRLISLFFQTLIRWFSKKDKLILTMICVTRRRAKEKYYLRASMTSELRLPRSDSVDILKGWSADLLHAAWRGNNCMWSNAAWPASSLFWYSLANLH